MGPREDNVQMYWAPLTAALLFGIAITEYVWLSQWQPFARPFAMAFFGFVSAIASHEVAEWTGTYRWSYASFWTFPPNGVRAFGLILLAGIDLFGFR